MNKSKLKQHNSTKNKNKYSGHYGDKLPTVEMNHIPASMEIAVFHNYVQFAQIGKTKKAHGAN